MAPGRMIRCREEKALISETFVARLDALAGEMIRAGQCYADAGDSDAALMVRDASEGVLALLDFLAARGLSGPSPQAGAA